MRLDLSCCVTVSLLFLCTSTCLFAQIHGVVKDPTGAAVPDAHVHLLGGPERDAITDSSGNYRFDNVGKGRYTIIANTSALSSTPVALDYPGGDRTVDLAVALTARQESVLVTAQRSEVAASTVASASTVITRADIAAMHAENAEEALRLSPGIVVSQTLERGNISSIFARGANSNMNLIMVDGIRINDFGGGFSDGLPNLPAENIERIEIVRGPQSALYGANAIGAVINIITRHNEGGPDIHGLAEGGSFGYAKGAIGGGTRIGKLSFNTDFMYLSANGTVPNGDYRNENASLGASYEVSPNSRFFYNMSANANESGAPGPYGSNPIGAFSGLDKISRSKENAYRHGFGFEFVSGRVRQRFEGSVHDEIYNYHSPYGDSRTTNFRATASSQTEIALKPNDSIVAGFEYQHEAATNTFLTDAGGAGFPVQRDEFGFFVENRYQPGGRFFLNTGFRFEDVQTAAIPAEALFTGPVPLRPSTNVLSPNPKLSAAWLPQAGSSTRIHGSVGTGLRAPDSFELAFTNNPNLKPERTTSFDLGVEQSAFGRRATFDVTYFYNRFRDLIVTLGPTQKGLSKWQSDNLSNARAQGIEFSSAVRPVRSLRISGHYTWNPTTLLALDGSSLAAPSFKVGQELIRRPEHFAAYDIVWTHRRLTVDTTGFFRSSQLDIEPNYGASGGLFPNAGYARSDAGVEFALSREVAIYARVRNINDARYEEVYGYPSLRRNFFAGLKFNIGRN